MTHPIGNSRTPSVPSSQQADSAGHSRLATSAVRSATERGIAYLMACQHEDGRWESPVEGDGSETAQTVMLMCWLGRADLVHGYCRFLLSQQMPAGGWARYPGGPLDIDVSVQAYAAIKMAEFPVAEHDMRRAQEAIIAHGGADRTSGVTRWLLGISGQLPYHVCPPVTPEVVLMPQWCRSNIYRQSTWRRLITVPLAIVSAYRRPTQMSITQTIDELFVMSPERWPATWLYYACDMDGDDWTRRSDWGDRLLRLWERLALAPVRRRAVLSAVRWLGKRLEPAGSLGGLVTPSVLAAAALLAHGHDGDSLAISGIVQWIRSLSREVTGGERVSPRRQPVRDTVATVRTLAACGVDPLDARMNRAVDWLLGCEINSMGDWFDVVRSEPGCWSFTHDNPFYPDILSTATTLSSLREQFASSPPDSLLADDSMIAIIWANSMNLAKQQIALLDRVAAASRRGRRWLLAMQNPDGGWGTFNKIMESRWDANWSEEVCEERRDSSHPETTGCVLETLGSWEMRRGQSAVDKGIGFMRRTQRSDGCWPSRWAVGNIHGTWRAITGLAAVGIRAGDPAVSAAARWLISQQRPSGAWTAAPLTGHPTSSTTSPTTSPFDRASDANLRADSVMQTAWAVLALLAAGLHGHDSVRRGVDYLLQCQQADGSWQQSLHLATSVSEHTVIRASADETVYPLAAIGSFQKLLK